MLRKLRTRTALIAAVGLTTAALVLTGCTSGTGKSSASGTTLTLAMSSEPASFDPALQSSAGDPIWRWHAVYDTLLRCDAKGNVGPAAAKSFTLSDDAKVLTMKMRPGMKFSDGSPVNAAAAKASIEHMQKGGGGDASRVVGDTITTPDDMTVVVTAQQPTGQLPTFMCFAPGIVASPKQLDSPSLGTNPISSGPYTLVTSKTTTGSVYTFKKRADYWDAKSYPNENLVIKVMTDVTARLNAVRSGQIEGASIDQSSAAGAQGSSVKVLKQLSLMSGLFLADRNGTSIKALGDVRVRQAINMVFDRAAIAKGLYGGEAVVSEQMFSPDSTAYVPQLDKTYKYDVTAAKKLMAQAGYPNGFDVVMSSREGTNDPKVTPMVIQQLALLNIRATSVSLSGPTTYDRILSGEFPIIPIEIGGADPLFNIVQEMTPTSIWNPKKASDPALDPLLAKAQTLQGSAAITNFKAINKYLVDQAWFVPWVYTYSYFALKSADLAPTQSDQFHLIPNLWDFK